MKYQDKTKKELIDLLQARERENRRLAGNSRTFLEILDVSSEGTAVLKSGKIIYCNAAMEKITGYSFEEIKTHDLCSLFHSEDRKKIIKLNQKPATGKKLILGGIRIASKTGTVRWVDLTAREIKWEGKNCLLTVLKDITEKKTTLQALTQSEEKFEKIFRFSPDSITISKASTGFFIDVNNRFTELSGWAPAETYGKTVKDLGIWVNEGDRDRVIEILKKDGYVQDFITTLRVKDGRELPALFSGSLITLGNELYLISTSRDMSEFVRAQQTIQAQNEELASANEELTASNEELEAINEELIAAQQELGDSEMKYRTVVNGAQEAILIVQDYRVVFFNPAFEKTMKMPESITQFNITDYIHPDDLPTVIAYNEKRLKGEPVPESYEIRMRDHRGNHIWAHISVSLISWEGRPATLLFGIDITELKKNEKLIRDNEARMRSFFYAATEGIAIHEKGVFLDVNDAFARIFGYENHELIGMTVKDLSTPETYEIVHRHIISRDQSPYEGVGLRKDGSTFYGRISGKDFIYQGKNLRVVSIIDITDLKELEKKILDALHEKETLLKEIHHRVKNNMQIISSMLSLQSAYVKSEEDRELFNESQNRILAMALIHENLYRSSNLSQINFKKYIFDLANRLFDSYNITQARVMLDTSVSNVTMNIEKAIPCAQIINELISNALKHAFPANRTGTISIYFSQDPDGKYTLEIKDNGIGFPENIDFRNTDSLGLQIINALVGQLKGAISMESAHDRGTKFTLTF